MQYFYLFLVVLAMSIGQILFKKSANILVDLEKSWHLIYEITFLSGIFLYGVTTLLWIWCLQNIELNRAYPFTALAYTIVPIASWFILGESINEKLVIGILFIYIGVILTSIA
jgi:drug/metabolite transporter (DMT)-like permease